MALYMHYFFCLPDGLVNILCAIISVGKSCWGFLLLHVILQLLFRKNPNSLFSCDSLCCNFFPVFLFVSKVYFFFAGFLSRICYCKISTYFQITFDNLLPDEQTKQKMIYALRKCNIFYSNFDAKECKYCTFP